MANHPAATAASDVQDREYDAYVRQEWDLFVRDPGRGEGMLQAARAPRPARVLDVGCGAGQQLLPFLRAGERLCVGMDVARDVGRAGRELTASAGVAPPAFVRASAESLPFRAGHFDLVICRLVLPYTRNEEALSEIARILRPGGLLFLQIHGPGFYLRKLARGLRTGQWLSTIHAARALTAGVLYHLTGRQPRNRLTGSEVFRTRASLARQLSRLGMRITGELPGSLSHAPFFVVSRE